MKKEYQKKGFTLIEVLGVIVVLAVIALITTPIILNVIEKAKKGALEDSAYGLLDSANLYYASGIVEDNTVKTEFTFQDGIQTSENKLSYKGRIENGNLRLYSDGKAALCITEGKYSALKNVNDKKVTIVKGRCSYNIETEEYETIGLCEDLQKEIDALKKQEEENQKKWDEFMSSLIGTTWDFGYTGTEHTFQAPYEGYFQLEVWGAQGGSAKDATGGYGGYATGVYYMDHKEKIYIQVGGQGTTGNTGTACNKTNGGYNGGGTGVNYSGDNSQYMSGGGGATHIALASGLLKNQSTDTLMIVAGGGGGAQYIPNMRTENGGSGGGFMGNDRGGTQTGSSGNITGGFGYGGSYATVSCTYGNSGSGGGSGYYGGGTSFNRGGGGGSGFIGSPKLISKLGVEKAMYCYSCATSNDDNTRTYSVTDVSSIATSSYAKSGSGYAKITYLGY